MLPSASLLLELSGLGGLPGSMDRVEVQDGSQCSSVMMQEFAI